jgi:methylmalonyl-CoA/ethylmalonyl-CoA epimerase
MTIANRSLFKINKAQQICFVVYDLEKSMERMWTMFSIGPWKVNIRDENSTKDNSVISDMIYMNKPAHFSYKLASALLETGLIIELVQPLSGENIYSDFLREHGEGMHHIGWHIVNSQEEFDKVTSMLEGQGFPCLQSARTYVSHIGYFDTTSVLNTILEVSYDDPAKKRPDPLYIYPTPK